MSCLLWGGEGGLVAAMGVDCGVYDVTCGGAVLHRGHAAGACEYNRPQMRVQAEEVLQGGGRAREFYA